VRNLSFFDVYVECTLEIKKQFSLLQKFACIYFNSAFVYRLRARKFQLIRLKPMTQVRSDTYHFMSKQPQPPSVWPVLNGITFSDTHVAPRGAYLAPTFYHPISVLSFVSTTGHDESSQSSSTYTDAVRIQVQSSSSSSGNFSNEAEQQPQELRGTSVYKGVLITEQKSPSTRKAIYDILEGCERKRKIAVLSEVLEEIRSQSSQAEGQSQLKRNQAITPTLEKSFFENDPHFYGCHATTKEKETNEDGQQLFIHCCEKNSTEESAFICSSSPREESLKINFVVDGDNIFCN